MLIITPSSSFDARAAPQLAGVIRNSTSAHVTLNNQELSALSSLSRAELIAFVPAVPALLFTRLARTVVRELRFSFEFLGRRSNDSRIGEILAELSLEHLQERDPFTLSGGEQMRTAIAVALVKNPELIVLDDVYRQMDAESERLVLAATDRARARGAIVIEFHSRAPVRAASRNERWLFVTRAGLLSGALSECWQEVARNAPFLLPPLVRFASSVQRQHSITYAGLPDTAERVASRLEWVDAEPRSPEVTETTGAPVVPELRVAQLSFGYSSDAKFRLGPIDCAIPLGRTTALVGPNGAGKTTLLRCCANLNTGWAGEIWLDGRLLNSAVPLHEWTRDLLYSFQNPDDQLFLPTVRDELIEATRYTKEARATVKARMDHVAKTLSLDSLLDTLPADLSPSFRRLVTIGSALVAAPRVLLLDEPTANLDICQTESLVLALRDYRADGGTTIVVTHDDDFVAEIADCVVPVHEGRVETIETIALAVKQPWGVRSTATQLAQALGRPGFAGTTDGLLAKVRSADVPGTGDPSSGDK